MYVDLVVVEVVCGCDFYDVCVEFVVDVVVGDYWDFVVG